MTCFVELNCLESVLLDCETYPLLVQPSQVALVRRWRCPATSWRTTGLGGLEMSDGTAHVGASLLLVGGERIYVRETVEQISQLFRVSTASPPLEAYNAEDLERRRQVVRLGVLLHGSEWRSLISSRVQDKAEPHMFWRLNGTRVEAPLAISVIDEWRAWALSQGVDSPYRVG